MESIALGKGLGWHNKRADVFIYFEYGFCKVSICRITKNIHG